MDADWGSGEDRRPIGGFAFVLGLAAISWSSKKLSTVPLSSTEAQYMALTQVVKGYIWLQAILVDLGAKRQVEIVKQSVLDEDINSNKQDSDASASEGRCC